MPSAKTLTAGITGTPSYTAAAEKIRARLDAEIPASLRLPQELLDDLPVDVSAIAETCGLLTPEELAITELDATAVRDQIAAGTLSAVDTVTAFGKRAVVVHQLTGCLTEIFLDEGIARAKELDEHFKKTGQVVGPLHGVPISVKEHLPVAGHYSSFGFLSSHTFSKEDCQLVAILRSLGAVFYVKTNQPQGIMHLECHGFHSRTLNPFNTRLSSGGSSGGEGALIGAKGSCLGLGTDIGGSIRNPCQNNGIAGMRPTAYQLPLKGGLHSFKGWNGISAAVGPMCRSTRDIALFINAVLTTKPFLDDPSLYATSWNGLASLPLGRKLKIGIMVHDDVVLPQPPILRALALAKEKLLKRHDVEVVEYKAFNHERGYDLTKELYYPDGANIFKEMVQATGEDIIPLSKHITGGPTKDHSAAEIMELFHQRDIYRDQYSTYFNSTGIDVLLCPAFSGPAPLHEGSTYWAYTSTWNILDYPGCIFNTGLKVDPALDPKSVDFKPMSEPDQKNYDDYNAELQIGAPVSLQVVAKRWNDAIALGATQLIEEAMRG